MKIIEYQVFDVLYLYTTLLKDASRIHCLLYPVSFINFTNCKKGTYLSNLLYI